MKDSVDAFSDVSLIAGNRHLSRESTTELKLDSRKNVKSLD